jgi:hypothetical protein
MGGIYGYVYEEVIPKRQKGITQKCYQKITLKLKVTKTYVAKYQNLCHKVQKPM